MRLRRERRALGRTGRWAYRAVVAPAAGLLLLVGAPPLEELPQAAEPRALADTCRVVDTRSGDRTWGTGDNLVQALSDAEPGDHFRITGICRGNFAMSVNLRLSGDPTPAYPRPTLDGRGEGPVLTVSDGGTVRSITLRDGRARAGGGIHLVGGDLDLRGTATVVRNRARFGGGIYILEGTVAMWDRAAVRRNAARSTGGGASIQIPGHLVMRERASVQHNTSGGPGGGIVADIGIVTMRGSTRVIGNRSGAEGGGIANLDGWSWFYGHARVARNVAATVGGGVFILFGSGGVCGPNVRLHPNRPDDEAFTGPIGC